MTYKNKSKEVEKIVEMFKELDDDEACLFFDLISDYSYRNNKDASCIIKNKQRQHYLSLMFDSIANYYRVYK